MKFSHVIFIAGTILIASCSPKITTITSKRYTSTTSQEDVRVYGLQEQIPNNSEELGRVKIDDTGFSINCGWEVVVNIAKAEARKVGGNAIKIINHVPPSIFGSSCDRIIAAILKVTDFNDFSNKELIDSTLLNADYALLHVYRNSGLGAFVSYDLYLGDSVICRVSNNWKKTIRIKKDSYYTLWARTEVKEELPINIKFGNEYYLRCGVTMGAFVGRPKLELVDKQLGRSEYSFIVLPDSEKRDIIRLNDDREIECRIDSEDSKNIYITIFRSGSETKTHVEKSQIKKVHRNEQ